MKHLAYILLFILGYGCAPDREDTFNLTGEVAKPTISVEQVLNDGNRFVVKDLSTDNYIRLWDFDKGNPGISSKANDTVFYSKAGDYNITLHISKADGSGTNTVSKKVSVLQNAAATCSTKLGLLTGDCEAAGKCWTMSRKVEAVKVGPTYDDFSWFKSPVNGLQDAQYDDGFCFTFDGFVYQNKNNGASVDPWDGYKVKPYDPGKSEFIFQEGTGINNRDQIIIPNDQFLGTWDNDNVMDIIKLTEKELVVRAKLRNKEGVPAAEGWFELTLEKK
jgi:PKD repeat protein